MNTLLLYLVPPERWQVLRYPQGLGSIAAVLKQAGHGVEVLTLSEFDPAALDAAVRRSGAGLAALSLTSNHFPLAREAARFLAAEHKLPVVLGGVHPTLCPEESIAAEGVSAICLGEGEYPMLELCRALETGGDPSGIANLWVRRDGEVRKNPLRPLIANLGELPFPDREAFDFGRMLKIVPEAEFMGSRGCPYRCTYCANHALQELYRGCGRYVRFRPVDHLLDEVEDVTRRYSGIGWLGFHDDTFTLNRRWLEEFCEKYPKRIGRPFWCNAVAGSITPDTVALLKQARCDEVRIGVESGNDRIRMEVLEKPVTREEIVRAFRLLREAGIRRYAFNMVGLPYETEQTVEDTVRLNREIRPDTVFCSMFFPYPGTKSHEICRRNGWLTGRNIRSYFEDDSALNQPGISARRVAWVHSIFVELVRHPRWAWLIRLLHGIPVTRTKSLWNALRRVRAKVGEWAARRRLAGAPAG